jgi:hypothetical protein
MMRFSLLGLALLLLVRVSSGTPLPAGPGRAELPDAKEPLTLFTYKPPTYRGGL